MLQCFYNKISFSRIYNGKLTEKEFSSIQKELKYLITEEDRERWKNYDKNIDDYKNRINSLLSGEIDAISYFNDLLEQELELYNTLDYNELLLNMNTLFHYPFFIENIPFEDLTFYKNERVLLATCSHENFAYMHLEDEEYRELLKLNIFDDI